jgi:predicted nucleic acid-binding protein
VDAFDSDVLIYAIAPDHPLGRRVVALFPDDPAGGPCGVGSLLLLPEVLTKPIRSRAAGEQFELERLLSRLELFPVSRSTADLAAVLGGKYGLKTVDAVHLATAVEAGADRFLTNNRRDFPRTISEIEILYPEDLPNPA